MPFINPSIKVFNRSEIFCYIPSESLPKSKKDQAVVIPKLLAANTPLASEFYYHVFHYKKNTFIYYSSKPFYTELINKYISTQASCAIAKHRSIRIIFINQDFVEISQFERGKMMTNTCFPYIYFHDHYEEIIASDIKDLPTEYIIEDFTPPFLDSAYCELTNIPYHQKIFHASAIPIIRVSWHYFVIIITAIVLINIKIFLWNVHLQQESQEIELQKKRNTQYHQLSQAMSINKEEMEKNKDKIITIDSYQFFHHLYEVTSNIQIYSVAISERFFIIEATLENPFILMKEFSDSPYFDDVSIEYVQVKNQLEYFRIKGVFNVV